MKNFKLRNIFFIAMLMLLIQSLSFAESTTESEKLPDLYFDEDYIYNLHPKWERNEIVVAIEALDPKTRETYYQRYFDMAVDYEKRAEDIDIVLVDKKKFLVLSINCFQIAKHSSLKEVKKHASEGLLRCRDKLVDLEIGESEDNAIIMQRCMYIDSIKDKKKKTEELQSYFKVAQDFENKVKKAPGKSMKEKYLRSALAYYGMVSFFTKDEETRRLADEARLRCIKMLQKLNP